MRRKVSACLLTAILALPTFGFTTNNNVKLLVETVRPLQWQDLDPQSETLGQLMNYCSVFSVNPENRGWMTAKHCVVNSHGQPYADAFYIDGYPAVVIEINSELDIALVRVPDYQITTQGLKLAKRAPVQGDRLEVLGYAQGLPKPFYFQGIVAQVDLSLGGMFGSFLDMLATGGMSGAAVVDRDGRVVGVVHRSIGGSTSTGPILGYTAFKNLKEFDRGWVFSR